jgi:DNA-binding transcriptional MerR regulator
MTYSIGELARRTGLTVKTIRYYSDAGLVPPTDRTAAGYRRYDLDAVARLGLIRTLRELGLDLATIRKILDRETALSDVAAAHAEALTVQIQTMRLRRAILKAVADRGSTPEELERMHKLSIDEHRLLVEEFLDTVFADRTDLVAARRNHTPELPEDPTEAQLDAWLELVEMLQDESFRTYLHQLTVDFRAERPMELLDRARDPRRQRYLELLATVNGWAAPTPLRHAG